MMCSLPAFEIPKVLAMECQVRDLSIHYEERGEGRLLLLLHGWPLDHRHIMHDIEPLFAHRSGWRRVYPDLPGMGRTRAANWISNQDQILEILSSFIDTIAPEERLVVGGTSYGAYLARGLVYQRGSSIDGLLLNVPDFETDPTKQHFPQHVVIHEDPEFLAALTPAEQDLPKIIVAQSMEVLTAFRTVFDPAAKLADHGFLQRLAQAYAFSFDINNPPAPFPGPSLILTGKYDHWCGYREAYQGLDSYPRASFAVLDRAGHGLSIEQPILFRALVNEWLDRVEEYIIQQSIDR